MKIMGRDRRVRFYTSEAGIEHYFYYVGSNVIEILTNNMHEKWFDVIDQKIDWGSAKIDDDVKKAAEIYVREYHLGVFS